VPTENGGKLPFQAFKLAQAFARLSLSF
jgi:hypothetical protein